MSIFEVTADFWYTVWPLYLWIPLKYSYGNEKILGTSTEEEITVLLE
jgi:hypothetical protein